MKTYNQMTDSEITVRLCELSEILNYSNMDGDWDKAYAEYSQLMEVQNERYREKNQSAFNAFYADHINGKKWEEINPEDWDFYSDWHKDMYGFRPHII